jgi:hypothetical protein
MRLALATLGMLLFSTNAFAQALPCVAPTLSYDPYKPSDAAIVRNYGGAVVTHLPLSMLLKLDPYVPSQAELLRQVGNGVPVWGVYPWHPYAPSPAASASVADCAPPPSAHVSEPAATPLTSFADVMNAVDSAPATRAVASTARTSQPRTRGVLVQYAGRAWISDGAAVPFQEGEFERVGESAGFPIYQRRGTKDSEIFVPTVRGMVAPFRLSR